MFNAAQKNVMSRKLRSKRLRHSLKPLFKRHDFFMLVYKSHDLRPVFKCHDFLSPIFHSHACLRSSSEIKSTRRLYSKSRKRQKWTSSWMHIQQWKAIS